VAFAAAVSSGTAVCASAEVSPRRRRLKREQRVFMASGRGIAGSLDLIVGMGSLSKCLSTPIASTLDGVLERD
jgi:hypothetical protein